MDGLLVVLSAPAAVVVTLALVRVTRWSSARHSGADPGALTRFPRLDFAVVVAASYVLFAAQGAALVVAPVAAAAALAVVGVVARSRRSRGAALSTDAG